MRAFSGVWTSGEVGTLRGIWCISPVGKFKGSIWIFISLGMTLPSIVKQNGGLQLVQRHGKTALIRRLFGY